MDTLLSISLQLLAATLATLALAGVARWMKLGRGVRIRNEAQARQLSDEFICGFEPVDVALDRSGYAALLRDRFGRVMLIRQHGAHFVGRLLDRKVDARLNEGQLVIAVPERSFGSVTLELGPVAAEWAASFRRLLD